MKNMLLLLTTSVLLFGCQSFLPPTPTASEHFKTTGGGIKMVPSEGTYRFYLSYKILKPFAQPVFAEVVFENPAATDSPIVCPVKISPEQKQIDVESPLVTGLTVRNYRANLNVYSDNKKQTLITQHTQWIHSDFNQKRTEKLLGR
jgi:hypothetical protein